MILGKICPKCSGERMPFKEGDGKVAYYTCQSYGGTPCDCRIDAMLEELSQIKIGD